MSKPYFEWRQNAPSELAQYVQTELPEALCWPTYISRFDLLNHEGARGVVEQLYKQLLKRQITYDLVPSDPQAGIIQQIRKPRTILDSAQATCLDLVLLLAGMCLANDLLPIVIAVDGHAFVGVSLTNPRDPVEQAVFNTGVLDDLVVLQQWAEDGDRYLFVECTGAVCSRSGLDPNFPEGQGRGPQGTMAFDQACQAGLDQILKYTSAKHSATAANQRAFLYALNIHDLQIKYGFAPVKDDEQLAKRPSSQTTHTQHISGSARVGVAVNGPVTGNINHTDQSGGINFGTNNEIGSIGDLVAGDKVGGDKVMGDKVGGDKVMGDKVDARNSEGFINRPTAAVTQVYGTQRNINTGGGDYAEGDIIKTSSRRSAKITAGPLDLDAVYGAVARAQRQVRTRNPDLAQDLDEVLAQLDAARTARANGNDQRYRAKLQQACSTLSSLATGLPELQTIVRMLEAAQ